jgi:hypothetical protein
MEYLNNINIKTTQKIFGISFIFVLFMVIATDLISEDLNGLDLMFSIITIITLSFLIIVLLKETVLENYKKFINKITFMKNYAIFWIKNIGKKYNK